MMLFLFVFVVCMLSLLIFFFFFFNDTATTEIYTLSLHDALPIFTCDLLRVPLKITIKPVYCPPNCVNLVLAFDKTMSLDRKSTRLNSSHDQISYAVFCLKKKKKRRKTPCLYSGAYYRSITSMTPA